MRKEEEGGGKGRRGRQWREKGEKEREEGKGEEENREGERDKVMHEVKATKL